VILIKFNLESVTIRGNERKMDEVVVDLKGVTCIRESVHR